MEMADYTDEGGTEIHSIGIRIERQKLSDSSVAFNVLCNAKGARIRFACTSEKAAWNFADELTKCAWIEVA